MGDNDGAIDAFQKCLHEEVGCAFGLALAKLRSQGPSAEIGEALLIGFAANRYVAPMLFGGTWERLDAFHSTNMAEPEWADDVIAVQGDRLLQRSPRLNGQGVSILRWPLDHGFADPSRCRPRRGSYVISPFHGFLR